MKNERLIYVIGKIDDDLIFNAVNDVRAKKKGGWFKWGTLAACLCLVVVAAFIVPNIFTSIPKNGQYTDIDKKDASLYGNPDEYNTAQGTVGMYDITDNEASNPPEVATMISSYGSMDFSACYVSPDNGSYSYSIPLREAMKKYGNTVLYRVVVDVFCNNQMLEANSEAVKKEMERLSELEYTVAFEKFTDGTIHRYYFTLHATQEQLSNFVENDNYGYMFWLYDERVQ